jgi:hypothetical protein
MARFAATLATTRVDAGLGPLTLNLIDHDIGGASFLVQARVWRVRVQMQLGCLRGGGCPVPG